MWNLIKSEPVLFQGVVQAGLGLLLSFGVHLKPNQIGEILAFVAAVLTFVTRGMVTPNPNVPQGNVTQPPVGKP